MTSRPVYSRSVRHTYRSHKVQGFSYVLLLTFGLLDQTDSMSMKADVTLVQMTVKKELGLDDAEAVERLTQLAKLLPGLLPRLPAIKARIVVTMAQDTSVSSFPTTSRCP